MKKIILLLITTFLFITGCVESDFNMHGEITVGNDTDDPIDTIEIFAVGDTGQAGGIVIHTTPDGKHGIEMLDIPLQRTHTGINMVLGCHDRVEQGTDETSTFATAIGELPHGLWEAENNTLLFAQAGGSDAMLKCIDPENPFQLALDLEYNGYDDWSIPTTTEMYLFLWVMGDQNKLPFLCGQLYHCLTSHLKLQGGEWVMNSIKMHSGNYNLLVSTYGTRENFLAIFESNYKDDWLLSSFWLINSVSNPDGYLRWTEASKSNLMHAIPVRYF